MIPIEVILSRQLADYLSLPIVIVDPAHVVVFYNEAAERLLGRRYEDQGEILWGDWAQTFSFADDGGLPIPGAEMPITRALHDRSVAHGTFWMKGLDGIRRHVEEIAIPLLGKEDRFLGVMAMLCDVGS